MNGTNTCALHRFVLNICFEGWVSECGCFSWPYASLNITTQIDRIEQIIIIWNGRNGTTHFRSRKRILPVLPWWKDSNGFFFSVGCTGMRGKVRYENAYALQFTHTHTLTALIRTTSIFIWKSQRLLPSESYFLTDAFAYYINRVE